MAREGISRLIEEIVNLRVKEPIPTTGFNVSVGEIYEVRRRETIFQQNTRR